MLKSPRIHIQNIVLVFLCFSPFLRFSPPPFYLLTSVAFSFLYLVFEAPRAHMENPAPLSSAHKLYLLLFYLSAGTGLGAFSAIVFWENSVLTVMAALIFIALFCLSFLKKDFTRKLLSFVFLVIAENVILFFFPEPLKTADYEKIKNQNFITPIFWFANEKQGPDMPNVLSLPKNEGVPRTILSDSRETQLFMILHGPPAPHKIAMKIPIKSFSSPASEKTRIFYLDARQTDNAGARDMALDEKHNAFYILGINGTIYKINSRTFEITRTFNTHSHRMMKMCLLKNGGNLLALSEAGDLRDYSLPSWTMTKNTVTNGNAYALLRDKSEKRLYIVQWGSPNVLALGMETFRLIGKTEKDGFYPVGADMNEEKKELYFTDFFRGELVVVDLRNFHILKTIKIQRGLREARWDKKRQVLYMGNFQKGSFYIFDIKHGKILKELFLGRKLRHIYITPRTHQVLAATRYGVFRVDVDGILKTIAQGKTHPR